VAPDPELRAALEREAAEQGVLALHQRLAQLDAAAAARLHPNDTKRVIRAIEVASAPDAAAPADASVTTPLTTPAQMGYAIVSFGLEMPREQLYRRLEERVDHMLQNGFMEELRRLANAAGAESTLALQSLGYRQMLPALSDPSRFDEGVALWKRDTRRYAKRQMTWFRHQLPVHWIAIDESTPPAETAERIIAQWQALTVTGD
jgi:tRNA dimethylallyltransferase